MSFLPKLQEQCKVINLSKQKLDKNTHLTSCELYSVFQHATEDEEPQTMS